MDRRSRPSTSSREQTMIPDWLRLLSFGGLRSMLTWCGVVILLVGLGSAVLIWRAQDRIERENDASGPLSPLDSRRHVRDVEIYYGKLGVIVESADELLHGKPLAKTISVVSIISAAGCFLLAARAAPQNVSSGPASQPPTNYPSI